LSKEMAQEFHSHDVCQSKHTIYLLIDSQVKIIC